MFQITNDQSRTFNVRVVFKGDRYGLNDCLTHDNDKPLVEFYDATQDPKKFGERGQFVSRYYIETLILFYIETLTGSRARNAYGLTLDGGVDAWTLDAESANTAIEWAASQVTGAQS
jgi:hypothetical protein